jgi:hypothetical protein
MKLLVMQLSPPSRHCIPLWSKYSGYIYVTILKWIDVESESGIAPNPSPFNIILYKGRVRYLYPAYFPPTAFFIRPVRRVVSRNSLYACSVVQSAQAGRLKQSEWPSERASEPASGRVANCGEDGSVIAIVSARQSGPVLCTSSLLWYSAGRGTSRVWTCSADRRLPRQPFHNSVTLFAVTFPCKIMR